MHAIEIQEYARKLKDAHGDKAILEESARTGGSRRQGASGKLATHRSRSYANAWPPRELRTCGYGEWGTSSRVEGPPRIEVEIKSLRKTHS